MSKRVLVVEDQEDNMQIMNDMLASAGYQVIKAVTGYEGVAMAESHQPDLILVAVMVMAPPPGSHIQIRTSDLPPG